MDPLDLFFKKYSYKFPKGYPDLNDEQDINLLADLLEGLDINLSEMNLAGPATGYKDKFGAFEKYIQNNPESLNLTYQIDRDAILYEPELPLTKKDTIKKNESIKIITKNVNDIKTIGNSGYILISYNNNNYLIHLSDIKKPTGKSVEKIDIDISNKNNPKIFHSFTPGHPQEKQVVELFINNSDENWSFDYDNKKYNITYLGDPEWKGKGKPKSDVQISFNEAPRAELGKDLRISLKASNAIFVENWILPDRAIQLIGKDNLKKEILDLYKTLLVSNIFKKGTTANNLAAFVSTKNNTYKIDTGTESRGPYLLTPEGTFEAYTGSEKFGENSKGSANCFFKGDVPSTIEEFIKKLEAFTPSTVENDLDKLYLTIRGSNESRGGSFIFNKVKTKDKEYWTITEPWIKALGIKEDIDPETKEITYN